MISVIADDGRQTTYAYDPAGNRSAVATVSSGVTQAPVAVDDAVNYTFGDAPPTLHPLANDSDPGGLALTVVGVGPPQFGNATFTARTVSYTPPAAHVGSVDAFAYTIENSAGAMASALIKITLINPAPIANPDSVGVVENGTVTFDPRANDSDPAHSALTITAITTPAHGAASFTATSVTYTPTPGYYGPDSIGYTIRNAAGLAASSTVSVTVAPLPPVVGPYDVLTTVGTPATFDPRSAATDPNGLYPLTVVAVGAAGHGSAAIHGGASITYTPTAGYTGADSFGYTVANSAGSAGSSTVNVTVQPAGLPLVAGVGRTTWNWYQFVSNPPRVDPPVSVTASGGLTPYTYRWQYVSGDTLIAVASPTSAATIWTRTMTLYGTYTATWSCTVTDALGASTTTPGVTVTFDRESNQ
ncbi:MAG: Ig-like domain-containing protein [Caulobacteraceae bacterium]